MEPEMTTNSPPSVEVDSAVGLIESLSLAWKSGDICLQLSALGVCIFLVLLLLILLAWLCYGSVISTVFDSRATIQTQFSGVGDVGQDNTFVRSSSYYIPWQQETFPLSPETAKIDKATKKGQ